MEPKFETVSPFKKGYDTKCLPTISKSTQVLKMAGK